MDNPDMVPVAELSRALDEIYHLRRAAAYEAAVIEAHLSLAGFPKSRRKYAEHQIERLTKAACGQAFAAYYEIGDRSLRHAMKEAGGSPTLTRWEWEAEADDNS